MQAPCPCVARIRSSVADSAIRRLIISSLALRTVAKLETYDGLDCSNFIFQSMCKLLNGELTEFLFVFKTPA